MSILSAQNGRAEHPGVWCADGVSQRHWTHSILVWDRQRQPAIQAVSVLELLSRYPCGEQACRSGARLHHPLAGRPALSVFCCLGRST
jgi:hypothetical protein